MNMLKSNGNILVVAAHPDDEILGCGGAVARLVKEGATVYVLILGEGVTSREETRNREKKLKELENLKNESLAANRLLGVREVFFHDIADNRFDTVPFLDIVKIIEKCKREIRPGIIFTHFRNDLNIDHQLTFRAVITATRPLPEETVRAVYSFESFSATEWNFPLSFSPNLFINIEDTLEMKARAFSLYLSELRDYPHPRSVEAIHRSAEKWGVQVGRGACEAFEVVSSIY